MKKTVLDYSQIKKNKNEVKGLLKTVKVSAEPLFVKHFFFSLVSVCDRIQKDANSEILMTKVGVPRILFIVFKNLILK